ncbi:MAG: toll/interleukin-1 receptor domain-containing protein [Anaerolineae bacterium]|nr:toll/interleukin-1 receptor domain-containing protein [Anaerolineae bacterium]
MTEMFFISHSAEDKLIAEALKEQIEGFFAKVYQVFVSSVPGGIKTGSDFVEELNNKLETSGTLILLVTPKSIHSAWVWFETGTFWLRWRKKKVIILPLVVRVADEHLPNILKDLRLQRKNIDTLSDIEDFFNELEQRFNGGDHNATNKSIILENINKLYSVSTIPTPPSPFKTKMFIDGLDIDWIILAHARYRFARNQIVCHYDDREVPLEPYYAQRKDMKIREYEEKAQRGELLPFNGDKWSLRKFTIEDHYINNNGDMVPQIVLYTTPTDYYTEEVTDQATIDEVRNYDARNVDVTERPVPQFASIIAVNINVITSDGYLIVAKRSGSSHTTPNTMHTSVAKNPARPTDAGPDGEFDPFRCAIRGIREELGVVVKLEDVEFTTFGVYTALCQYSLIGWTRCQEKASDIYRLWSLRVPNEPWKNRELYFVRHDPHEVADFIYKMQSNGNQWFSIGLASVVLSLFQVSVGLSDKEIGRIEKAFFDAKMKYQQP